MKKLLISMFLITFLNSFQYLNAAAAAPFAEYLEQDPLPYGIPYKHLIVLKTEIRDETDKLLDTIKKSLLSINIEKITKEINDAMLVKEYLISERIGQLNFIQFKNNMLNQIFNLDPQQKFFSMERVLDTLNNIYLKAGSNVQLKKYIQQYLKDRFILFFTGLNPNIKIYLNNIMYYNNLIQYLNLLKKNKHVGFKQHE